MRDGVRLATDIYRPARGGEMLPCPFPVLLERTPYGKHDQERRERSGRYWARRGYIGVIQDCRGCHHSEGELYFLAQEAEDGYDCISWLSQQPWCNGKVGTHGTSYAAWTQSAAAALNPPGLAAMLPNMGGANAHTSSVRQGGAMELRFMAWAFWHSALNTNRRLKATPGVKEALNQVDFREWLTRLPLRPGQSPLSLAPSYERWLMDIYTRADYDDFWKQPGLGIEEHWETHADVPMYFCGGWYDSYTRSTLESYVGLSRLKKGPVRVIMGPWTHGARTAECPFAGDVEFGHHAALDSFQELHLRWFDQTLKGVDTGILDEPPIRIFVMGGGDGRKTREGRLFHGGRWRYEHEWPLARARSTSYYVHGDGSLSTDPPEEPRSSTTYSYNPANPVPSIGGNVSSLAALRPLPPTIADPDLAPQALRVEQILMAGAYDQRTGPDIYGAQPPYLPLSSRADVLVFQTPPLERDMEVTGPLQVALYVSSDCPDTDFTAKLIDVYPPSEDYPQGYAMNISDSILRARYRSSRERAEPMVPGEVYTITITLYPTSNLFAAGHRIRLDISSSNFPRFDANPNTGEPIGKHRSTRVARNTLWHDAVHPSHLVLPVIPGG